MEIRSQKTKYGTLKYTVKDINDILSDKDPEYKKYRKFGSYRKLLRGLPTTGRSSTELAKIIQKTFFDVMLRDLIMNNHEYVLPYKDFCSIHIGYREYKRIPYVYNIPTGGPFYIPRIKFTEKGRERIHRVYYFFSLREKYQKLLYNEIFNKGHKYSNE